LEGLHKQRAEEDTLRVGVVQDFDGVTIEDGDDLALILRDSTSGR
jgi:hypothetical protein